MVTRSRVIRSITGLPGALIPSAWVAGLLIVIVGFTGSLVLVLPAAQSAGLTPAQLGSWAWAICVGSGVATLLLSLVYKQPVLTAWSTPGLALLGTALAQYRLSEAVGAYIAVGAVVALLGISGLFERVVRVIPQPVALAVLAGLLLKYGLALFTSLAENPLAVAAIIATYLLLRRLGMRVPMAGALLVGFGAAWALGLLDLSGVRLELTTPVFVWPEFTPRALVGLGLPLLVLALASQDLPGFAVMRAAGYTPPVKGSLIVTGLISVLLAPALNHGQTLAAITAAIGNSPEAHPDPQQRYGAAVVAGALKIILGLFGATVMGLLVALPSAVVAALAGLALSGTILSCLTNSFAEPKHRDSALWALLVTASGVQFFGIGSAFWGFVAGVLVNRLLERER
ncbi:MAG: benzoate/H(+) symporter BenE family transporter [Roseiflexaceae bacterium]|nr:benzoate/H(+) symporter BenE family transporter [Roseiflexaceae bacterium]